MRIWMTIGFVGAAAAAAMPAQAGTFQLNVLNIQNETFSSAYAINDSNQAVGSYEDFNFVIHGLVWQNGQAGQVDAIGGRQSRLVGINARGVAVGDFAASGGGANAFTYNLASTEQTVVGGNSGSRFYQGLGITNTDTVFGDLSNARHPYQAYIARNNRVRKFNVADAAYTVIATISDRGEVLGYYVPRGDTAAAHGFTLRGGTLTSFDAPGAVRTLPAAFGGNGTIVGSYLDGNGVSHGFARRGGVFTTYDHPAATGTMLVGMGGDLLVGNFSTAQSASNGFFYDGKTYTDWSIPGSTMTQINGVNAGGSLAGSFFSRQISQLYGFIAICPKPPCTG
jgi:hypothetical protein